MKKFVILLLLLFIFPSTCFAAEDSYINVKVGKSVESGESFTIQSADNFYFCTSDRQKLFDTELKQLTITFQDGKLQISNNLFQVKEFPLDGQLMIGSKTSIQISTNRRSYRGFLSFRLNNGKLDLINHVDIDDYLKGVVPKEMSEEFPIESLKAQAVCSRSFAYANRNKYKKLGYDLNDTTACQVYYGQSSETKKTSQAVEETKGEVLFYNGQVANAIFGSNSGGITAADGDVWGGRNTAYLEVQEDPYSHQTWEVKLSELNIKNLNVGEVEQLNILERDSSTRVKKIEIVGTAQTIELTGNQFRDKVGNMKLKSTLFDIFPQGKDFLICGRGFGHGVGMSQDGAVTMAKQGFSYSDILNFYFPGTKLHHKN